ncbi:DedA family protein [Halobacillus salinarum]|uniref:DedA family protein n=1 Tax=Halobacillus salinarum TaxID=2932257 RepID=A0ABY4EMT0_9BACI|nr:DedA family protein [Halobacillus salinarum]UOQ45760.1 DedA family protein [Halobacillus salinarum]
METWLIDFINHFGYAGVLFLIAIENLFPPIPSEVILTFSGYMTTYSELSIAGVMAAAAAGSIAGAFLLYGIGTYAGAERMYVFADRWGRYLRLTKNDIQRAEAWFNKYGAWTVFLCRFVPLVRSLISLPAGMARMNIWSFFVFTLCGTMVWNFVLIKLGAALGASWHQVVLFMDAYAKFLYVLLFLGMLLFLLHWLRKKYQ